MLILFLEFVYLFICFYYIAVIFALMIPLVILLDTTITILYDLTI